MILFLIPLAVNSILRHLRERGYGLKFFPSYFATTILTLLFLVQFTHFFTAADIFSSDSAIQASKVLNREFSDSHIAAIDSFTLSVLLNTQKRSSYLEMTGLPVIGRKLLSDPLPEVAVFGSDGSELAENQPVLESRYSLYSRAGNYFIYSLK